MSERALEKFRGEISSLDLVQYLSIPLFAEQFVDKDEFTELMRPGRMLNKFWELTNNVEGTKFLLVSWMPTVEGKSELYLSI